MLVSVQENVFLDNQKFPFNKFMVNRYRIQADLANVQAVGEVRKPMSKDKVMSFLYIIMSNSTFIPDLAMATVKFTWTK